MLSRMIAVACVAIAVAPSQLAAADLNRPPSETQLRREATLFFADVLPQLDLGYGPCTFSAEWARYSVWAELFDVPIHGYLDPPDHRTQLSEILDPSGQKPGWLCDDAEIDALVAEAVQRDGARVRTLELTFPIFNENFDRAVIVLINRHAWLYRPQDGNPPMILFDGGGSALIYERRNGHWTRVASYGLFSYH